MGDGRAGTTSGSHAEVLLMALRMGGVLSKTWISKQDQERIFKVGREHTPTYDTRSSSGAWQPAWVRSAQSWLQSVPEPEPSLHPSWARSTQKWSSHFVLQLPRLCWARGSELQDRDTDCLDCTCRITGSDLGVGWQHFIEAILYFLYCPIATAPCQEDPCRGSWIPVGKAADPLWGISRGMWELSRLPGARDPATTAHLSAHCPMCDYNGFHHPHPSPSCVYNHRHYSRVTEQKHPMQIRDAGVS